MDSIRDTAQAFLPLFVTIDAIGLVPIFIALTADMPADMRKRITYQAVATAAIIAFAFAFAGHQIFRFLGITNADFKVAGGIILLILAIIDLLIQGKPAVHPTATVGIVPLAMPLIAGPATLTTVVILAGRDGYTITSLSLALNFAFLLIILLASGGIARLVGASALTATSKLVMLLLAAIAVSFIHSGIREMIEAARAAT